MKIPLQKNELLGLNARSAENEALERAIRGCQMGDWNAKNSLARIFHPLLHTLAEKRVGAGQTAEINKAMERGRQGLFEAAHNYKPSVGIQHFRIFALPYIEKHIDGRQSFWSRVFGKRSL
jgi:DNA-directed RNA polymerase specialized sigma subunit